MSQYRHHIKFVNWNHLPHVTHDEKQISVFAYQELKEAFADHTVLGLTKIRN